MQPKPEEEFIRALNMRISRKEKAKQRTEEKIKAAQKAEKERLYNPFTYRVRHPFPDNYYKLGGHGYPFCQMNGAEGMALDTKTAEAIGKALRCDGFW